MSILYILENNHLFVYDDKSIVSRDIIKKKSISYVSSMFTARPFAI